MFQILKSQMGQTFDICKNPTTNVQNQLRSHPLEKQYPHKHPHVSLLDQKQQHDLPANSKMPINIQPQPQALKSHQEHLIQAELQSKYIQMRSKQEQFEKAKENAEFKLLQLHEKQHKDDIQQWLGLILHKYQRCLHFYELHDLDTTHQYSVELANLIRQIMDKKNIDKDQLSLKLDQFIKQQGTYKYNSKQMQQQLSLFELEYSDILLFQDIISKTQFIFKQQKNGRRLSTKKQQKSIGVLIELDLTVQFQRLIAILTEVQYFNEFVPYVQSSTEERQVRRNCKLGYGIVNFPIITRREYYFQGVIYDRLKHTGQLFMYVRSIQDKPHLQKIFNFYPKMNKDYVPLDYRYFVLKYKPVSKGVGQIRFAMNVDIGLNFIPQFIEQIAIKTFANDFFTNILKLSKTFQNSKWQEGVKKRPQTFDFFRLKIDEHVRHLQHQKNIKPQSK